MNSREWIEGGNGRLGIELGSTRIKAVLLGADKAPIASGSHEWENRLENGVWTYTLEDVWQGMQSAYADLNKDVQKQYGVTIKKLAGIGISAMMHGYLVFDENDKLLAPFRTWRNTMTQEASAQLTEAFSYPIPQRWSVAHLWQAILNGETHTKDIRFMTDLDGYVHYMLTGQKVLGVGAASGVFPIDSKTCDYRTDLMATFDKFAQAKGFTQPIASLLPKVLCAGENAGTLTKEGAALLDPTGALEAGAVFCPPEGDAGTGMVATNSVRPTTANVSAGTSVFAMVVLEQDLKKVHSEIDLVTTPSGDTVAMVHCNNCTSDLNAWVGLFGEFAKLTGQSLSADELYGSLYRKAMEGDADCGGLLAYNYFSGEHVTDMEQGRPLFVRTPDAKFTLANFMRTHLYASLATLKMGLDILSKEEQVRITSVLGHGGLFKTEGVGQQILADAIGAPVSVMQGTAGEGGAYGIALLADYTVDHKDGQSLSDYLEQEIFAGVTKKTCDANAAGSAGFAAYTERYRKGLAIEKTATENL